MIAVRTAPDEPVDVRARDNRSENLLADVDLTIGRLRACLDAEDREDIVDGFLLAAGLDQAAEDYLHRDVFGLNRLVNYLGWAAPRMFVWVVPGLRVVRDWAQRLRLLGEGEVVGWQAQLSLLVRALAGAAVTGVPIEAGAGNLLTGGLPWKLRRAILRLPTCFRSLDQHPDDVGELCRRFAERYPDRARPLAVVGLRTSGSYLAPIATVGLRALGFRSVTQLTFRPGQVWLPRERQVLAEIGHRDGLVLMIDDPPDSGSSLRKAAVSLEPVGIRRENVVLLLGLLGEGKVPPAALDGYQSVLLPFDQWSVARRLRPEAVGAALAEALVGRVVRLRDASDRRIHVASVTAVQRLNLPAVDDLKAGSPARRHVRALYRIELRDSLTGDSVEHDVYVKGIGLGYLGRHATVLTERLAPFLPETYRVDDGLLYRAWLPEDSRLTRAGPDEQAIVAEQIARYVALRRASMGTSEDLSYRVPELNPVWLRVARLLESPFGRGRFLARPLLERLAARLLRVDQPCVVDGSMALSRWFRLGGRLKKVDYDERAFSNQDTVVDQLYCFDPIFDLAGTAADADLESAAWDFDSDLPTRLRKSFETVTGEQVAPERWLLYRLLHIVGYQRMLAEVFRRGRIAGADPSFGRDLVTAFGAGQRALASAYQDYVAEVIFGDTNLPVVGELCAIDIDGVLESDALGFLAVSPLGAIALRALTRHGFRPVLATGRSLRDVRRRCRSYRLAGGVAEYGCVVHETATARDHRLLTETEACQMSLLARAVDSTVGIHRDRAPTAIVRAFRLDEAGRRRALHADAAEALLQKTELSGYVRVVHGSGVTDFIPSGHNKGRGLEALATLLTGPRSGAHPLALAVGDTMSDLLMLRQAIVAFAPANAAPDLRAQARRGDGRIRFARRPGQRGLAEAVASVLDHAPGSCSICAAPVGDPNRKLLGSLLEVQDGQGWGKLGSLALMLRALLAARAARDR